MHNTESVWENRDAQTSLEFRDTNRSSNLGQTIRPSDSRQEKRELVE